MKLEAKSGKIISIGCCFPPKFVNSGILAVCVCVGGGGVLGTREIGRERERNGFGNWETIRCRVQVARRHIDSIECY